jgi:hypothetical protein
MIKFIRNLDVLKICFIILLCVLIAMETPVRFDLATGGMETFLIDSFIKGVIMLEDVWFNQNVTRIVQERYKLGIILSRKFQP